MKKIVFVFMLVSLPSAVFCADRMERMAIIIDNAGARWQVNDLFASTVPGGFYKSRFCLTVVTDTFRVAIPPENLISIEVKGENSEIRYRWMEQEQTITGKISSELIGGKSAGGYYYVKIAELKRLTFKEGSAVMKEEKPHPYRHETTLVLIDGTRVPVANLYRISSQSYAAIPSLGMKEGTAFTKYNDVGFLQGKTAPTIQFEDVKSMEFPTENSITLTLKQGTIDAGGKDLDDFDMVEGDLDDFDFGQVESDAGKLSPKNWAYGFTGIYSKGYFFIPAKQVKAIEFSAEQE
jgi:hypothetical protein